MANTIKVEVVSAETSIFSGEAVSVVLPGSEGEFGVLPKHTPFITLVKPGLVIITKPDQSKEEVFVHGGVIEVQPDVVTVLSDTAVHSKDLDEARAKQALAEAQEARKVAVSDLEIAKLEAEIALCQEQLVSIRRLRRH